jgi:hypothetical protein
VIGADADPADIVVDVIDAVRYGALQVAVSSHDTMANKPENNGRLSQSTAKEAARTLRALRIAVKHGWVNKIRIVPPAGRRCPVADSQVGRTYSADRVPELPLPNCQLRSCGCSYAPVGTIFERLS